MSSTKSQVAVVATNIPNHTSAASSTSAAAAAAAGTASSAASSATTTSSAATHSQRDYNNEESSSLGRQSSFGNNRRGNPKGKHLTRSHAMRESTSPPRTPTPRAEHAAQQQQQHVSPNGHSSSYQQHQQSLAHQNHSHHSHAHAHSSQQMYAAAADGNENYGHANNNNNSSNNKNGCNNNNSNSNSSANKLHAQINSSNNNNNTRGTSPIIETPSVIITSQQTHQQQQQQQQQNVPLSNEAEFPKLTPPKSKTAAGSGGGGGGSSNGVGGSNNNSGNNNVNNANGQRGNGSYSSDANNKAESNSCNGTANNNSNKKLGSDFKYGSGGSGGVSNSSNAGGTENQHKNGAIHKQMHHQHTDNAVNNGRCQAQANNTNNGNSNSNKNTASAGHYNSAMNYNAPSTSESSHQQQQPLEQQLRSSRHDSHNSSNAVGASTTAHEDEPPHQPQQQQQHRQQQQHHYQQPHHQHQQQQQQQQQQHYYERERGASGGGGGGANKKHRASSSSKGGGPKPRLKNMGSSGGSVEGGNSSSSLSNNSSGFISRENSGEYTDNGGTDLITFFRETLNNKNIKDRHLLLKIEKDLIELIEDEERTELRFPSASSYNRMLIHRTAAYFGMDHNVDAETQQCVIVAATKGTRIPDIRFKSLVRDSREDSRKSILKRDTHSFDEQRQSSYLCPDRGGMLDRKAKSFEEREEDYDRARSRIFNRSQHDNYAGACGGGGGERDEHYMSWASSMEQQQQQQQHHHHSQQQQQQQQLPSTSRGRASGKMVKIPTSSEVRERGSAGAVPKAHSYVSYGGPGAGPSTSTAGGNGNNVSQHLLRGDSAGSGKSSGNNNNRNYGKQDYSSGGSSSWRLSPSNNGCKSCSQSAQSIFSDSVSQSPTADYRSNAQTPELPLPPLALPLPQFMACCQPSQLQPQPPFSAGPIVVGKGKVHTASLVDDDDDGDGAEDIEMDVRPQMVEVVGAAAINGTSTAVAAPIIPPQTQLPPFGLVWAVTDITNVPKGSVLINPQTLRPIINQDGSIYHFDPTHLPPNPNVNTGGGGGGQGGNSTYSTSGTYQHSPQAQVQQQAPNQEFCTKKSVNTQQQQQQTKNPELQQQPSGQQQQQPQQHSTELCTPMPTYVAATNQTSPVDVEHIGMHAMMPPPPQQQSLKAPIDETDESQDSSSFKSNEPATGEAISDEETSTQSGADECDNTAAGCLSITTTTSTKNYDRIEVQKFKNQATSPNIPCEKVESATANEPTESLAVQADCSTAARNLPAIVNASPPATATPVQSPPLPLQQPPQPQPSETPQSSRSTPYSGTESHTKRASEEHRPQTWTYTQSYQAADGSTVFHTANTPSANPYCATTYQQGPDGSVYAIPQGMVYAYPQQDSEVQGYFMPVYDAGAQQRSDAAAAAAAAAAAGIVPAGAQPVFPSAATGAATMVPMAAAYPTTQFATTNGAPIFQGQVIYPSEQQQIPMTTYPTISYPYPYNGYWGQTMTYYVPTQQATLANAMQTTHLLATPQQAGPPPGATTAGIPTAQPIAGGVNLASGILATPSAQAHSAASSAMANSGNPTTLTTISSGSANGNTFHVHSGTTYYGTGRVKRPVPPPHYSVQQAGAPHVVTAAGVPTIQQFAQAALSTLTLAAAPGNAGNPNELNANTAPPAGTAMYALPQHATVYSTNIYPYAAATAAAAGAGSASSAPLNAVLTQAGAASAAAIAAQPASSVITPYYAHRPQVHAHAVPVTPIANTGHAPGPSAIPIVDPATLNNISSGSNSTRASSNASGNSGASHSAPPTPLSQTGQITQQRNPPLFSTPPIMSSAASYSASSTPQYFTTGGYIEQPTGSLGANSAQGVYVTAAPPSSSTSNAYEKRSGSKKPSSSSFAGTNSSGNSQRQNSSGGSGATYASKPPIYGAGNENHRGSPNNNARSHNKGKGGGGGGGGGGNNTNLTGSSGSDKTQQQQQQQPLLASPTGGYMQQSSSTATVAHSYNPHYVNSSGTAGSVDGTGASSGNGKPPIRLNAAAASFRQKSNGIEFRRSLSLSQRNSPGTTNSTSSNDNSNNNSPSSVSNVAPIYATTAGGGNSSSNVSNYGNNSSTNSNTGIVNSNNLEQQQQQQQPQSHQQPQQHSHQPTSPSVFIATAAPRSSHIPGQQTAQLQHGGAGPLITTLSGVGGGNANAAVVAGSHTSAVTVLGGTATAVEVASAAHHHHHHHHQPLLGTYNPGAAATATGVYFKYGQTYLAHPTVSLPNSRRSPSTDLRPPMAQMTGMYPAVNMTMIAAPPQRHTQGGRHPNPNYKGSRPR